MAERHENQYLASANARSDAKDKKDQGLSRVVVNQEEIQGEQTVRVKAVPIVLRAAVLLKATVLLRVAFSILARLVQRKGGKQQVEMMEEIHWLQLIQGKQQSRVIHHLGFQTHSLKPLQHHASCTRSKSC